MKRRKLFSLISATTTLVTIVALSAAPSSEAAQGNSNPDGALNFLASEVGDQLSDQLSGLNGWAGEYFDGSTMTVNFATSASTLTSISSVINNISSSTGLPIKLASVSHSEAQLDAISATLVAEQSSLLHSGIELTGWGLDVRKNVENIDVETLSDSAVDTFRTRWGDMVSVSQMNHATLVGRYNDSAPWIGGDEIDFLNWDLSGVADCSSGFSAIKTSNGNHYALTAGHCFNANGVGQSVNTPTSAHFGTVAYRNFGNNTWDGAAVHIDPGLDNVWSDPHSTTRDITGSATSDPTGVLVCYDGSQTTESCGADIQGTGYCESPWV